MRPQIKIRGFCNGSNIFLVVIILFVLILSFYRIIRSSNQYGVVERGIQKVRIIDETRDNFNTSIYYGWHQGSIWKINTIQRIQVGKIYFFDGEKQYFGTENQYQKYDLSLGILGSIKVKKIIYQGADCNYICTYFYNLKNLKRLLENKFFSGYCHDWYFVIKEISPSLECSQIGAFSKGLTLGGSEGFSKDMKEAFKTVGVIHIIVVSGFQVGLMASLVEFFSLQLRISRKIRFSVFGLFFVLMISLVGPLPPVIRSVLSFLITNFFLLILNRRISSFRSLIYSSFLMLLIQPRYLFSISFQLSFLATFGLLWVLETEFFSLNFLKKIWVLIQTSLLTNLFTLPIIANISGKISLISLPANVLLLPVIPFLSISNYLSLIPFVGKVFFFINATIQSIVLTLISDFAKLNVTLELSTFKTYDFIIYYGFLLLILMFLKLNSLE